MFLHSKIGIADLQYIGNTSIPNSRLPRFQASTRKPRMQVKSAFGTLVVADLQIVEGPIGFVVFDK